MNILPQVLVNGLVTGSVYALIAVGFALSFGVLRRVNFAHGATSVVGGYTGYLLIGKLGLSFWAGVGGAMIIGAATGLAVERLAFRPFRRSVALAAIVSSLACAIVIENLLALIFGEDVRSFRSGLSTNIVFPSVGVTITQVQLLIIAICVLVGVSLYVFFAKTAVGHESLAVSDDPSAAATWGIDGKKAVSRMFMLSSAIAGLAGYLVAFDLDVDPHMGTQSLFKAFTANVLFGVGSLGGSVAGGILLGLVENLVTAYVSSRYRSASTFVVLLLLLLARPRGILNLKTGRFR